MPTQLVQVMVLCEGESEVAPAVGYRAVAKFHSPALGWRLASFVGEVRNERGTNVDVPVPRGRTIEPVTVADPNTDAAELQDRLWRAGHRFGVLMDAAVVVGVVTRERLASAPSGMAAAGVAVWPLPVFTTETNVDEIADRVRAAFEGLPDDLRGIVIVRAGMPVGFVSQESFDAVAGRPGGRTMRGVDLGTLAGAPVSRLIFRCETHQEEVLISYYDPSAPPKCSHGDLMSRRRDT